MTSMAISSHLLSLAARPFQACNRDALMNRPITAQQRTSCHAAPPWFQNKRRGRAACCPSPRKAHRHRRLLYITIQ
ncbi:hypothetical protein Y032_0009g827 [Ancylostoma ceylanicum]|uniref:Uncharacterized protein n=1 Tax=Ancylostoma ceylanicum TaxID=53326 RepID=A0A016VLJ8_9BILA|nr:hypothetical protein Y032_0009g827 [Ancylostoma ceylanicum]